MQIIMSYCLQSNDTSKKSIHAQYRQNIFLNIFSLKLVESMNAETKGLVNCICSHDILMLNTNACVNTVTRVNIVQLRK
jgi:hypothetical protein